MNTLQKIIRKLFLVKEIVSRYGQVHFRRYRLLETPWFALYIHQILRSDEDVDPHDHPWDFSSIILKGSYTEVCWRAPNYEASFDTYFAGDVVEHKAEDAHKLSLRTKDVWTLVVTSGRQREWGYRTRAGWISHKEYRDLKTEGKLR